MRLLVSMLFVMIPLCAQPPQQEGGRPGGPPEPKNLKVLKPDQPIIPIMRSYTVALGVRCDFCHVRGDFASDANPKKNTARMMITMTRNINANFNGRERVTCYTCHRGAQEPPSAPPAGEATKQ